MTKLAICNGETARRYTLFRNVVAHKKATKERNFHFANVNVVFVNF